MQVRCSLCGQVEEIAKWSEQHDRLRQQDETYVCEGCQRRVQSDALRASRDLKPL